eukprot:6083418-Prymnesium_polylepis.1
MGPIRAGLAIEVQRAARGERGRVSAARRTPSTSKPCGASSGAYSCKVDGTLSAPSVSRRSAMRVYPVARGSHVHESCAGL